VSFLLAELIEGSAEAFGEFGGRAVAPIVKEDNYGLRAEHVVMDRHDVEIVGAQGFQHALDLRFAHGDVARDLRIGVSAGKSGPGIQAHARVDRGAHLFDSEVVAADGDLVDGAELLAGMAGNTGKRSGVECARRSRRRSRGGAVGAVPDLIEGRLEFARDVAGFAVAVEVQEEEPRLVPEKVVVQGGDINSIVEQGGEDGIDFLLGEDEIPHEDFLAAITLGHGDPTAKAEGSGRGSARDGHLKIRAGHVDLENARFVVAGTGEGLQDILIVCGNVLGNCSRGKKKRSCNKKKARNAGHDSPFNGQHKESTLMMRARARSAVVCTRGGGLARLEEPR